MTFGGAETLIYNFSKELKNEFNISFITGLDCPNEWEYKFKEITPRVYHLYNLFKHDKNLYLEFISNYITTRNVKILHIIHTNFIFDILPELKKRHPELKIVITMFNDFVDYFRESTDLEGFVDYFSTDNNKVANSYKAKIVTEQKIKVIPNGIDGSSVFNPINFEREEIRESLGLEKNDISIFFVGRLSKEKNPDVFIKVARKLKESSNCKFFIIGEGIMKKEILSELNKVKNVEYLGYLDSLEVAKYLSAADVFVLPSAVEGFPLSILEAMAMKSVVIASNVGAIPDIINNGKTGFIVDPGSAEQITDVLRKLSKNRKLLNSITIAARKEFEEKYSSEILKKNYMEFYKEILK